MPASLLCCCASVVGLLLTLFVEFFYLTDNFMVRMNTIFKFYFQALGADGGGQRVSGCIG